MVSVAMVREPFAEICTRVANKQNRRPPCRNSHRLRRATLGFGSPRRWAAAATVRVASTGERSKKPLPQRQSPPRPQRRETRGRGRRLGCAHPLSPEEGSRGPLCAAAISWAMAPARPRTLSRAPWRAWLFSRRSRSCRPRSARPASSAPPCPESRRRDQPRCTSGRGTIVGRGSAGHPSSSSSRTSFAAMIGIDPACHQRNTTVPGSAPDTAWQTGIP